MSCGQNKQKLNRFFRAREEDIPKLLSILHGRLPLSCNVFNMVKTCCLLQAKIYVLDCNDIVSSDSVVLVNTFREEMNQEIGISVPSHGFDEEYLKNALSETEAVDWGNSYKFSFLEASVGSVVLEISVHIKGNYTHCTPAYAYILDKNEECAKDNLGNEAKNLVLKPIDMNEGLQLILNGWEFSEERTGEYLHRILKLLPSTGMYLDDRIISGAMQNANGVIGMLYTRPEERNQGYGVKVMRHLIHKLVNKGLAPCSATEIRKLAAQKLHDKVGMRKSHAVDYIWHQKSNRI